MSEEVNKLRATSVHIVSISNETPDKVPSLIRKWMSDNQDIVSDPGAILIFSPYVITYSCISEFKDGTEKTILKLNAWMERDKWATLKDADELRAYAFQLQDKYEGLEVEFTLSLSIKGIEDTDRDFNFMSAFMIKNATV